MKQIITVAPKPGAVIGVEDADVIGEHSYLEDSMGDARDEFLATYPDLDQDQFVITVKERPSTNAEFIEWVMSRSTHGALMQGFIMERLLHAAQMITDNEDEVRKQMENGFIDANAWIGCAKELQDLYKELMQ